MHGDIARDGQVVERVGVHDWVEVQVCRGRRAVDPADNIQIVAGDRSDSHQFAANLNLERFDDSIIRGMSNSSRPILGADDRECFARASSRDIGHGHHFVADLNLEVRGRIERIERSSGRIDRRRKRRGVDQSDRRVGQQNRRGQFVRRNSGIAGSIDDRDQCRGRGRIGSEGSRETQLAVRASIDELESERVISRKLRGGCEVQRSGGRR